MGEMKGKIVFYAIFCLMAVSFAGCGTSTKPFSGQEEKGHEEAIVQAETIQGEEIQSKAEERKTEAQNTEKDVFEKADEADEFGDSHSGTLSHEGYTLEQVVVLSRHNIRSPLSGSGSVLEDITPHKWITWSSNPSELSLRGGALETMMGQFFRRWMETEKLFPDNYKPEENAVRIYANAKQRTIATAQFFSAGLLPTGGLKIETHADFDDMDPVFNPQLTFVSDEYIRDAKAQAEKLYFGEIAALEDNYLLLMDIIDMEESKAWKEGTVESFRTDDTEIILKLNAQPNLSGSLKMAGRISDALVLQYYEEPEDKEAAFGNALSREQWRMVSEVKDTYQEILFSTPLIAVNVAHPLLQEIRNELTAEDRKFAFLCGHDSNIGSVMASLGANKYVLPDSIEKEVPIGCKLVFSKWSNTEQDDERGKWLSLDLVYQTADQLRGLTLLDIGTPPAVMPVTLENMERNGDGLYAAEDVMKRIERAIAAYDDMIRKY